MLRKLPKDVTLHSFSFLSSKELRNIKTVSKDVNKLSTAPKLWKDLLKREFDFSDFKDMKNVESYHTQLSVSNKALHSFLFLTEFLEEVQNRKLDDKLINHDDICEKFYFDFANFNHYLKKQYPDISFEEIEKRISKYLIPQQLSKSNKSPFFYPCISLNIDAMKQLIDLKANVNATMDNIPFAYQEYNAVTPLFMVLLLAINNTIRENNPTKSHVKKIIQLLLENGADPDAVITCTKYRSEEDSNEDEEAKIVENPINYTIREFCIRFKIEDDEEDQLSHEILDLIISAPPGNNENFYKTQLNLHL